MSKRPLHERITEQFSYRGEGADVWRAFDRFLETESYLNLGYSPWYLPHVVGSSQRRLAEEVGDGLAARLDDAAGVRLLDVGCGRGGPATAFARAHGFDVTGVDLVPYNVEVARRHADEEDLPAEFLVGDATRLPIATGSMGAATAVDALVYVPEERAVFEEFVRVLRPGGVVAVSDLLARDGIDDGDAGAVDAFAEVWDMPGVVPVGRYVEEVRDAGLGVEAVQGLTGHSVGRFRTWSRLYLAVAERAPWLLARALDAWDLDAGRITEQVRAAHRALPHLRHVLVYARKE